MIFERSLKDLFLRIFRERGREMSLRIRKRYPVDKVSGSGQGILRADLYCFVLPSDPEMIESTLRLDKLILL